MECFEVGIVPVVCGGCHVGVSPPYIVIKTWVDRFLNTKWNENKGVDRVPVSNKGQDPIEADPTPAYKQRPRGRKVDLRPYTKKYGG